jgi:hypothetical protein
MVRVLKPTGSLWVNLGDKYSGAGRGNNDSDRLTNPRATRIARLRASNQRQHVGLETTPAKSLLGMPWRYALRCIDELGLILRAEVVWAKTAGMPESVTDRVRRCHEQWFHFTLQPQYYSALDRIREPHSATSIARAGRARRAGDHFSVGSPNTLDPAQCLHPRGRLPGSVWTISPQPFTVPEHVGVHHYAAFPMEWPRRLIVGWSPEKVCTRCGQGCRPVPEGHTWDHTRPQTRRALDLAAGAGLTTEHLAALRAVGVSDTGRGQATQSGAGRNSAHTRALAEQARCVLGGYAREFLLSRPTGFTEACACPDTQAATVPGVVLDPFAGSGTVALVAAVLGRQAISVDASGDYCRLATWRIHDPRQQARARGLHTSVALPAPEQDSPQTPRAAA